ncbi:MAG: hypothetical protein Q4D30_04500 [Bacteroidales bacterium]|nr:hypothetical protein [Bacteroidales bacterium]
MFFFINYWDFVVQEWFNGRIEQEQQLFINSNYLNLNSGHMPEPYWGNPMDCSLVIANYNPGGGADRNIHTYKECISCKDSFINEVNKRGYFTVVKDFPIIDSLYDNCKQPNWWWDYKGSKWWIDKVNWLQQILSSKQKVLLSQKPPFALEFCGWHSKNWPNSACTILYNQAGLANTINYYFINALVNSVQYSDAKLGICIGRQFFDLFKRINPSYTPQNLKANNANNYNIYRFIISGAEIIVIWGSGWNRFPNINPQTIP